jgi:aquaporin Z
MDAKKYAAEAIGTFWLTFAGCGSAVIAAAFPQVVSVWSVCRWRSG